VPKAPITQNLKKGDTGFAFDKRNEVFMVTWHDNAVVNLLTNFDTYHPLQISERYSRSEHKKVKVKQPNLIHTYSNHMGGVDSADNAISNYRIKIRGRKWWWPLFSNALDMCVMNAWKLHCFIQRTLNKKKMCQLKFRSEIARALLYYDENNNSFEADDPEYFRRPVHHRLVRQENGNNRRCKVCHKHTVYKCEKCNVHVHIAFFHNHH